MFRTATQIEPCSLREDNLTIGTTIIIIIIKVIEINDKNKNNILISVEVTCGSIRRLHNHTILLEVNWSAFCNITGFLHFLFLFSWCVSEGQWIFSECFQRFLVRLCYNSGGKNTPPFLRKEFLNVSCSIFLLWSDSSERRNSTGVAIHRKDFVIFYLCSVFICIYESLAYIYTAQVTC